MAQTIVEAKGLDAQEVEEAVQGALKLKNTSGPERKKMLAESIYKVLTHSLNEGQDREFAVAMYKLIKSKYPDIS